MYEKASSQKVNRNKASIFFSRNTHPNTKTYISSIVGIVYIDPTIQYEKYLYLLAVIDHSKMNVQCESLKQITAFVIAITANRTNR